MVINEESIILECIKTRKYNFKFLIFKFQIFKKSGMAGTERERGRIALHLYEEVHFPLFYFILQFFFFYYMAYTSLTKFFRKSPLFGGCNDSFKFLRY